MLALRNNVGRQVDTLTWTQIFCVVRIEIRVSGIQLQEKNDAFVNRIEIEIHGRVAMRLTHKPLLFIVAGRGGYAQL